MARDAAERLRELVAAGEEIPYEVHESGDGSPLLPLRAADRALRPRPRRRAARARLLRRRVRGDRGRRPRRPYLEEIGIAVPDGPAAAGRARRGRLPLPAVDGLHRLLARRRAAGGGDRRARGRRRRDRAARSRSIVPLRGLQMPARAARPRRPRRSSAPTPSTCPPRRAPRRPRRRRLGAHLPRRQRASARRPDERRRGRRPDAGRPSPSRPSGSLITTLRLFKAGGVGLGPHAWTRIGGDRWRRIATGAGPPAPGRLPPGRDRARRARRLLAGAGLPREPVRARRRPPRDARRAGAGRSRASRPASSATSRSRRSTTTCSPCASCSRAAARPSLGLAMRVAALCAEPDQRDAVKAVVDRALGARARALERRAGPAARGSATPAETAAEIEELARAILKDAACGHLGSDLRATADEILLADGLAVGDGPPSSAARPPSGHLEPTDVDEDERPGGGRLGRIDEPIPIELDDEEPELIDELARARRGAAGVAPWTSESIRQPTTLTPPDASGGVAGVDPRTDEILEPQRRRCSGDRGRCETRAQRLEEVSTPPRPGRA